MNDLVPHEGKNFDWDNDIVGASYRFLLSNLKIKQAFLTVAAVLPTGTITVNSTKGFEDSGTINVGGQSVTYTGRTATTFTGCAGGTGTIPVTSSVQQTGGLTVDSTLAGGVGEVTYWTGGGRIAATVPTPTNGILAFTQFSFLTGANANGPAVVRTLILATTLDNTGKALYFWHISDDGVAVSMAGVNGELRLTPYMFLANVGETA